MTLYLAFFSFLEEHKREHVGNGNDIKLSTDNWLRYKIKYLHLVFPTGIQFMQATELNSIIQDINWNIPHGS